MDGPIISSKLPAYNSISKKEIANLTKVWGKPLSGYLGGIDTAGYWVEKLTDQWKQTFYCEHAIPCNSATSGLLAALMAVGVGHDDLVWVSSYTMSATASVAMVLGARVEFKDIEPRRFGMNINGYYGQMPKAIIVTNLFGHAAYLHDIRRFCDANKIWMIEDNAQAPLATENNVFTGTIGHIGVFSLNVHKHIQCGEGGVIVTNSEELAFGLRGAINHGELSYRAPGLNLRMNEPTAALACSQLDRIHKLVGGRKELAYHLTEMMRFIPWVKTPIEDQHCKHSFYVWAGLVPAGLRKPFVDGLRERGFPMRAGYITPLHKLFDHKTTLRQVEQIENEIITFEVCAYNPNLSRLRMMKKVAHYVAEQVA